MKLRPKPFESIACGRKVYELRLFDDKRKAIMCGDLIEFRNTDTEEFMCARVTEIRRYPSFRELYSDIPKEKMGYLPDEFADPTDMGRYYSREDQEKHGVVAIGIELIP